MYNQPLQSLFETQSNFVSHFLSHRTCNGIKEINVDGVNIAAIDFHGTSISLDGESVS